MFKVGSLPYFIILITLTCLTILLYFFLKTKSKKFAYNFLLVWCFSGLALHFLKQLIYWDFGSIHKSTAENICAVSTLVFPFIMLYKKKSFLHDFMYCIGILGGLAGIFYPTEVIGKTLLSFESIRFFFCHYSLFAIPLLLALLNIYKPRFKVVWLIPFCLLGYETIICFNTWLLLITKLYVPSNLTRVQAFFDHNILNNSFVFGPTDDMGKVGHFVGSLCPNFMKIDVFHINDDKLTYWPVIWLLIPSFVLFVPLYLLISAPFLSIKSNKKI